MASIRPAPVGQLYEIEVPLPDQLGVLSEELVSQDLGRVRNAAIAFAPEAIVPSECGDATCRAQPSTCHNDDVFLPHEFLGRLNGSHLPRLLLVITGASLPS